LNLELNAEFDELVLKSGSRNISVGIETVYGVDGRGSTPCREKGYFSTSHRPDLLCPPSPSLIE
jgi:hypothetical protein